MFLAPKIEAIKWQPTASVATLKQRAAIIAKIRKFFFDRNVLEVETPLLCESTVTSPHIQSISTRENLYLQTSPEYAMKRLLAAGSGCIFQICKAFRAEEQGRLHNNEFTMLEWYRLNFNHHDLMNEVDELLQTILNTAPAQKFSYEEIFEKYLQINPHSISTPDLFDEVKNKININESLPRDEYLNLLMTHCIEPHLGFDVPCMIYDFPASMAALAKIRTEKFAVASRFEVYVRGIELANGFHELQSASEQRKRFEAENQFRNINNLPLVSIDEKLLAALDSGLPDCAGVALGLDRLILLALQKNNLNEVNAF